MLRLALALPLILLAACNKEAAVDMENASVGEVANKLGEEGGARFVDPGRWQRTVTLLEIEAPGMPPEVRQMMRQAMARPQVHQVCLSPEDAKSPKEDFVAGAEQNCRYERATWSEGKVDLKLNCQHPEGSATMLLTGEYRPDSYTMTMAQTINGGAPGNSMVMKLRVDAKRVGDCDPNAKAQVGN